MMRAWKTHDLCDLFNATLKGHLPPSIKDHRYFNRRDWVRIQHVINGWPECYRQDDIDFPKGKDDAYVYETDIEPFDGIPFRSPAAGILLCKEGVVAALRNMRTGFKEWAMLLRTWLQALSDIDPNYGDDEAGTLGLNGLAESVKPYLKTNRFGVRYIDLSFSKPIRRRRPHCDVEKLWLP